jgi:hypothetical protein
MHKYNTFYFSIIYAKPISNFYIKNGKLFISLRRLLFYLLKYYYIFIEKKISFFAAFSNFRGERSNILFISKKFCLHENIKRNDFYDNFLDSLLYQLFYGIQKIIFSKSMEYHPFYSLQRRSSV